MLPKHATKMMVDYPGPGRVLLEVLQPLSHGCHARLSVYRHRFLYMCVCLNYSAHNAWYCTALSMCAD